MGFDPQTAGQPLVNPQKRTTKVNISVAIAVVGFLLLTFGYIMWKDQHPADRPPAGQSSTGH